MKKLLATILVFALILPVLAGCQSALAAANTPVTPEKALDIALEDAGLTVPEVHDVEVEPDRAQGSTHYDVDFEKDGKDYDYEIDAETGTVVDKEVPTTAPETPAPTAPTVTPETVPQSTVGPMLRDEAVAIALAHAKLTEAQVRDLDVERDDERGTPRYEVDFEAVGWDYEYEIHAETGEILYSQKERD